MYAPSEKIAAPLPQKAPTDVSAVPHVGIAPPFSFDFVGPLAINEPLAKSPTRMTTPGTQIRAHELTIAPASVDQVILLSRSSHSSTSSNVSPEAATGSLVTGNQASLASRPPVVEPRSPHFNRSFE